MRKRRKKKASLRLKIAITISLIFIWLLIGFFNYLNSPKIQSMIFTSINKISTLNIESARLKISIFKRQIEITNANLYSKKKNQRFKINEASFKFKILPLFKGTIKISDFNANGVEIDLAKKILAPKEKRPKISLTNLVLLRNLSITNGNIRNIKINTPKSTVNISQLEINFIPSFWGDIRLSIKAKDSNLASPKGPPFTIGELSINGSTDVSDWLDIFPYVDNLTGGISCKNVQYKDINIEDLNAKYKFKDKNLYLDSLEAIINGDNLIIAGNVDVSKEHYDLDINIPKPIFIKSPERESSFTNFSGSIKGSVKIKGKGFNYKTTIAEAELDLEHTLAGESPLPAHLSGKINIENGKVLFSNTILKVGEYLVPVQGDLNFVSPHINIAFEGSNIPVEAVLRRFRNKHYWPTKGVADVTGKVTGWKPNLKFDLHAIASPASYYEMVVDKAILDLEVTYHDLKLKGELYQNDDKRGDVFLEMKMGRMLRDGTRHKEFDLKAEMKDMDLSKTLAYYEVKGRGNGRIHLSGTINKYNGTGYTTIDKGSVKGISFAHIASNIKFSKQDILFSKIKLALAEINPTTFPNPIQMDIENYGVRFHGEPRQGFSLDAKYLTNSGSWDIKEIAYTSLDNPAWESSLKGTIAENGNLNLRTSGILDIKLLSSLRGLFREAEGPITLENLHITGNSLDPAISGTIILDNNTIQPRDWGYLIDNLNGELILSGHNIKLPDLSGRIEYGEFSLKGDVKHHKREISHVDIEFVGNSIMYATHDRIFRTEVDCDLKVKGGPSSSLVKGNINILDGRYSKNFSIFEKMKTKPDIDEEEFKETEWKNVKLDVKVKSNGDLKIDNNIGEIWLNTDLEIRGTMTRPKFVGNIDTVDGQIHYAGLTFDVDRGFIELRDPYTNPFVEFTGSTEVGRYNVNLIIRGPLSKLRLDLESTPPLDRKNLLTLITFGVTEDELKDTKFGYQIGTGLVAEQIAAVLQGPVKRFTPLDRFRIESSPTGSNEATRVHMGKDVSDRLRINFITDLNSLDAQQMFQAEYLLTDFMLLKGSGTTETEYRFNLTFRFTER